MTSRSATLIAAVVLLLGAGACGSRVEPVAEVATQAPVIAVVGDSITEQSKDQIEAYGRERGFGTSIDATAGFMTQQKQAAAEAIATTHPQAAVIALGTNDAVCRLTNALISGSCRLPSFTLADMVRDLTRMAETLHQPGTCVVGVTVYFGEEVGTVLDDLVAAGLLDGVVDWRRVVSADDSLRADGIGHLTDAGEAAYARFLVDETARICGL